MTKKLFKVMVCGLVLMAFAFSAQADQKISPTRVKNLVEKAVKQIEAKGDTVFPELSDPNGEYVDGDLYVFTYDMNGTIIQHLRPKLVGMNMMNIKDKRGKCIGCDFVRIAREEGAGWSEYYWPKPSTKKITVKVSYIMKVPGKERFVGAGVYDLTKEEAEKAVKAGK
ncbi:MAG: cache domain-containing protein [Deltaproteobacteria bacterium]|nr:cache domain-containing protein [Deltaproteobacteria bacterium]